nr:MAG TPA: hypothetical protein [Caudoviricetes sp.]
MNEIHLKNVIVRVFKLLQQYHGCRHCRDAALKGIGGSAKTTPPPSSRRS